MIYIFCEIILHRTMTEKNENNTIRLDKWLWCARFYKTRSLAAESIKSGKIKINGDKAKPSKLVSINDNLFIRKESFNYDITVLGIPKNRLSASLAIELYEETQDSIDLREQLTAQIKAESKLYPRSLGRPTKRDRRQIVRFKTGEKI